MINVGEITFAEIVIFEGGESKIKNVLAHELCHALGYIGHSTVEDYLMYHEAPANPENWIPLTKDQVAVLCTVYKECFLDE